MSKEKSSSASYTNSLAHLSLYCCCCCSFEVHASFIIVKGSERKHKKSFSKRGHKTRLKLLYERRSGMCVYPQSPPPLRWLRSKLVWHFEWIFANRNAIQKKTHTHTFHRVDCVATNHRKDRRMRKKEKRKKERKKER